MNPCELDTELRLTIRPLRSFGRYGRTAWRSKSGPRTLILYCQSKSGIVHSGIVRFLETPALLIMMSIWNLPVLGWAKWFFAVLTM